MGKSSSSTQKVKYNYMPGQKEAYSSLLSGAMGQITPDYYSKLIQPYTGQFTAPLSADERYGIGWMKNILTGSYDPRTSPYYQGLRQQAQEDIGQALTNIRQSANLGGMLASTPRIAQEAQAQRKMVNDLSTVLGSLYEQERARQTQILPLYMQSAGLSRQIQQEELNKKYLEFIRQMEALGLPLRTAIQLASFSPAGQTVKQTQEQPLLNWLLGGVNIGINI